MIMKAVFHVYLYEYGTKMGFKILKRDCVFYGKKASELNGKPFTIIDSSGKNYEVQSLEFAESNGNMYGSFIDPKNWFRKKDLIRVEIDLGEP
jgi:hypothetical protein